MNKLRTFAIFGAAIGLGTLLVVAAMEYRRAGEPLPLKSMQLTAQIAVAGQLTPAQLAELKARGFATIIAMRPDGEEMGQPSAREVREEANKQGMGFAYVPLPKGDIVPAGAVVALVQALAANPEPVLLYCRSGRRAARTWSLLEASRPAGASAPAILAAVKASGHSADDLAGDIAQRVARRSARYAAIK